MGVWTYPQYQAYVRAHAGADLLDLVTPDPQVIDLSNPSILTSYDPMPDWLDDKSRDISDNSNIAFAHLRNDYLSDRTNYRSHIKDQVNLITHKLTGGAL